MRTHKDLIEAWGEQEMADDLGQYYTLVHNWKTRNAIPYQHWPQLVTRAPMRGLNGITYDLLFSLQRGRMTAEKSTRPKKNGRRPERTTA